MSADEAIQHGPYLSEQTTDEHPTYKQSLLPLVRKIYELFTPTLDVAVTVYKAAV